MRKCPNWIYVIIFLVLIAAAGVRYIHLNGDAPVADISRSGVFYVDEGTYAHNVINKILFDKWFIDFDYNAITNVPIFSLSQYFLLKVLGVSLKSLRITGIIYSCLSILILWLLLKMQNISAASLALLLASINYFFIISLHFA